MLVGKPAISWLFRGKFRVMIGEKLMSLLERGISRERFPQP
jgi:hypothetical protein